MITTPVRTIAVLMALLIPAVSRAQSAASRPIGIIGERFVEVAAGQVDSGDDLFDNMTMGAVSVNYPASSFLDLTLGFAAGRAKGETAGGMLAPPADQTTRQRTAQLSATGYLRHGIVASFLRASGGYEWSEQERVWTSGRFGPGRFERRESNAVWAASAGAEIQVKRVAVTPLVQYQDTWRNIYGTDVGAALSLGISGHMWLTHVIGAFAQVTGIRPSWDYSRRTWSATAGLRARF